MDAENLTKQDRELVYLVLKKIKDKFLFTKLGSLLIYNIENFFGDKSLDNTITPSKEDEIIHNLRTWGALDIERHEFLYDEDNNKSEYYLKIFEPKLNELYNYFDQEKGEKPRDKKQKNKIVPFEIPKRIEWKDVSIKFKNNYDIEVKIGKKIIQSDYADMGFADNRSGKEEKIKVIYSWKILFFFSIGEGKYSVNKFTGKKRGSEIKQVEILAKMLKQKFPITSEEKLIDEDNGEYTIKFKLIPPPDFMPDYTDVRKKIGDYNHKDKRYLDLKDSYKELTPSLPEKKDFR